MVETEIAAPPTTDRTVLAPLTQTSGTERMFPTLTPAQIATDRCAWTRASDPELERCSSRRESRSCRSSSSRQVGSRLSGHPVTTETLIAVHGPGQFTGEVNMLSGRPALVRSRASEPGEVIELDREHLLALVQTDSELSEIIMRAFILRRVELIAQGLGDVVLVGSNHCSGTLRVKEFLTRNGHPYSYIDLDRDADVQDLLDQFHVTAADVPVRDLPRRGGAAESDQSADRRLPRL